MPKIGLHAPSLLFLWLSGTVLFQLLYTPIFVTFWPDTSLVEAAAMAASNVVPLAALAVVVRAMMKTYVMELSVFHQGLFHLVSAPVFALVWYAAVVLLQSVVRRGVDGRVLLQEFSAAALVWQAFQGLVVYALIAAICYAVRGGRDAAPVSFVETPRPLERYLLRAGDEFVPIAVEDIVSIAGAQDYSEVATVDRRLHLVRLSLGEFERRLDPDRFVRVHRSTIVNLAMVQRVEPAGNGRMTAHLSDATSVEVSRSGAQTLRRLVV